jgi:predicted DNA-binding transcriptional regulator YafY
MKFYEYQAKLDRIRELARTNATGSPKELARRIEVSERTLYRLVQNMRDQGIPLEYCRRTSTYYLDN